MKKYSVNRENIVLIKIKTGRDFLVRKIFYPFSCEYCFSHYVTILFLIITRYTLLFTDWRGYIISGFAIVWIANMYMSIFLRLRLDIKKERVEIESTPDKKID